MECFRKTIRRTLFALLPLHLLAGLNASLMAGAKVVILDQKETLRREVTFREVWILEKFLEHSQHISLFSVLELTVEEE